MSNINVLLLADTTEWSINKFLNLSGCRTVEELKTAILDLLKKYMVDAATANKLARKFEAIGITVEDIMKDQLK